MFRKILLSLVLVLGSNCFAISEGDLNSLREFVASHATRGDCQCGRCLVSTGTLDKPPGHKVNLTFFEVGMKGSPDDEQFKKLVHDIAPVADREISYIALSGLLGDQGVTLEVMGLGHLLGVWKVLSPDTVFPSAPSDVKQLLAARGLITIRAR